jgi:hypothetical protein
MTTPNTATVAKFFSQIPTDKDFFIINSQNGNIVQLNKIACESAKTAAGTILPMRYDYPVFLEKPTVNGKFKKK